MTILKLVTLISPEIINIQGFPIDIKSYFYETEKQLKCERTNIKENIIYNKMFCLSAIKWAEQEKYSIKLDKSLNLLSIFKY